GRVDSVASEADGHLLVRRKAERGAGVGHAAHHQPAVIAVGEGNPFRVPGTLIAEVQSGLKCLVMVNAEHALAQRDSLGYKPAGFGRKISRSSRPKGPVCLEAVNICCTHAASDTVQFRVMPCDGEGDRRIQKSTEI